MKNYSLVSGVKLIVQTKSEDVNRILDEVCKIDKLTYGEYDRNYFRGDFEKLLLILSLSIILLTSVYAWVNRHLYHEYTADRGFKVYVRENIFIMDRCNVRLGFAIDELEEENYDNRIMKLSYFPDFCKEVPDVK